MGFLGKIGKKLFGKEGGLATLGPAALTTAGHIYGSSLDAKEREKDRQAQEQFARMGIRWRVEDAKAAGVHPLVALGANTQSYNSVYSGDQSSAYGNIGQQLGQDISRSINATRTVEERTFERLRLEHAALENEMLRQQILNMNDVSQVGPALPSNSDMPLLTGQGDSRYRPTSGTGYVVEMPLMRTHSQPGRPEQEVGAIPDYGYSRALGGYAIVPGKDVAERIEDKIIPEAMWNFRNTHLKSPPLPDPRYFPLPKGYKRWAWNPLLQQFFAVKYGEDQSLWSKKMRGIKRSKVYEGARRIYRKFR